MNTTADAPEQMTVWFWSSCHDGAGKNHRQTLVSLHYRFVAVTGRASCTEQDILAEMAKAESGISLLC
jgi:hypothetical protein